MINLTDQDKFMLNVAQQVVPGSDLSHHITPDNKLSEGIDSVERHQPAPWLPLVRYDNEFRTHVVISSQKAVAFANMADGSQFLVPAGYALLAEGVGKSPKYTAEDVRAGVKNAKGEPVKVDEEVMAAVKEAGVKFSAFCGINNYNVFRHAGGDGINPNQYNYRNFNPQPTVSYNMDYAFEYPMVKPEDYETAPLVGISAFVGSEALAGQFVTYDANSNFVLADPEGFGYGQVKPERIIGQVSKVKILKDPKTGEIKNTFHGLKDVVNAAHLAVNQEGLNNMPGHNNGGLTAKMSYANAYGLISFSIQTR